MRSLDARLDAIERKLEPRGATLVLLAPHGVLTPRQHAQAEAATRAGRGEILVIELVARRGADSTPTPGAGNVAPEPTGSFQG
jgi:sugar phosphate isomerase/epimerase